jgi:predicted nucleotidyltransferase
MITLPQEVLAQLRRLLSRNRRVMRAILFGSRAKGNAKPGSDIDIALEGRSLSLKDILDLQVGYDQLDLPYKLDLLILDKTEDIQILKHIRRVGQEIYSCNP